MEEIGQVPILIRKEVAGFALNRVQGAVLDEAFALVEGGYISPEDLDLVVMHGLAPRWSIVGPFETIDLNAPGGVSQYAERYSAMYRGFRRDRGSTRMAGATWPSRWWIAPAD